MSKFTDFRNKAEAFFGHTFDVAEPLLEKAGLAAGEAALSAHMSGADGHAVAQAALAAVKNEAPEMAVSLQLALAATAQHDLASSAIAPPSNAL